MTILDKLLIEIIILQSIISINRFRTPYPSLIVNYQGLLTIILIILGIVVPTLL